MNALISNSAEQSTLTDAEKADRAGLEHAVTTLFLAGAESAHDLMSRGTVKRSGESDLDFQARKLRAQGDTAVVKAITEAAPAEVFDRLVRFAQMDIQGDTPEDAQFSRNQHLLRIGRVIDRVMRQATDVALFHEKLAERKANSGRTADDTRQTPDAVDLGHRTPIVDSTYDTDNVEDMTARDRLRLVNASLVIEALEALYRKLFNFHALLQQSIVGFNYEPQVLRMYSASVTTEAGTEWLEAMDVDTARQLYYRAQEERKARVTRDVQSNLANLAACFG